MPSQTAKEILSTRLPKDLLCTSYNLFWAFQIFCRNSSGHLYFYQFNSQQHWQRMCHLSFSWGPLKDSRNRCPMIRRFSTDSAAPWLFPLSPAGVSASSAMREKKLPLGTSPHIKARTYLWDTVCVRKHWFEAIINAYVIQNTHCYLFVVFIC